MPSEYAAIVLSGIVISFNDEPISTELPVGLEIHLPYLTKDGSETSLLVAAGPDFAVNSLTAIRVPAGTKNSRPVGFLR
jgi:hypothetical protein